MLIIKSIVCPFITYFANLKEIKQFSTTRAKQVPFFIRFYTNMQILFTIPDNNIKVQTLSSFYLIKNFKMLA